MHFDTATVSAQVMLVKFNINRKLPMRHRECMHTVGDQLCQLICIMLALLV